MATPPISAAQVIRLSRFDATNVARPRRFPSRLRTTAKTGSPATTATRPHISI